MKLEQRAKVYGVIGTIFFQIALLLLLWFSVLSRTVPYEEQGLSMALGIDAEGGNDFFEASPAAAEVLSAYMESAPPVEEEGFQTQDIEKSVAIQSEKKEKSPEELRREQELKEQQRQKELELQKADEAKALKDAQNKKAEEIENRTKTLFVTPGGEGTGGGAGGPGSSNTSSGKGTGKGTGNQGNPFGSPDGTGSGNGSGTGSGSGTGGNSYSLAGRTLVGELAKPTYDVYEEGKIVVTIIVNKNGTVISAVVGSGTNIDNPTLRNAAVEAAKKTKFDGITTDKNQSGTITYLFKLQ